MFNVLTGPRSGVTLSPMKRLLLTGLLLAASSSRAEGDCDDKELALQMVTNGLRGTRRLADAAAVLIDIDQPAFRWNTDERKGELAKAGSLREFWKARVMTCYEFVHYAAYFAGHQPMNEVFDVPGGRQAEDAFEARSNAVTERLLRTMGDVPGVQAEARAQLKREGYASRPNVLWNLGDAAIGPRGWQTRWKEWDGETEIPRGMVVVGVAVAANNTAGYFHTGISMGRGMVVSLRGDVNLKREPIEEVFGSIGYRKVLYGEYPWDEQQRGTYAPPRPLRMCPQERDGDTIRAGPRR